MFIFFAPLGFDLCEVGQEEVILKTGKQANRRTMHFALQSLLALFGESSAQSPLGMEASTNLAAFLEGEERFFRVRLFKSSKQKLPALQNLQLKYT